MPVRQPRPAPSSDDAIRQVMDSVRVGAARLLILRCLDSQPGASANDAIMRAALHHFGVVISRAECMRHLRWLNDQALIEMHDIAELSGICSTVTLTSHGAEVAQGIVQIHGVDRPEPA